MRKYLLVYYLLFASFVQGGTMPSGLGCPSAESSIGGQPVIAVLPSDSDPAHPGYITMGPTGPAEWYWHPIYRTYMSKGPASLSPADFPKYHDPCNPGMWNDNNGNGMPDLPEYMGGGNPSDPNSNPWQDFRAALDACKTSSDGPACMGQLASHPLNKIDSDGDGYSDADEIQWGTNPGDPRSYPDPIWGNNPQPGVLPGHPPQFEPWYPYPDGEGPLVPPSGGGGGENPGGGGENPGGGGEEPGGGDKPGTGTDLTGIEGKLDKLVTLSQAGNTSQATSAGQKAVVDELKNNLIRTKEFEDAMHKELVSILEKENRSIVTLHDQQRAAQQLFEKGNATLEQMFSHQLQGSSEVAAKWESLITMLADSGRDRGVHEKKVEDSLRLMSEQELKAIFSDEQLAKMDADNKKFVESINKVTEAVNASAESSKVDVSGIEKRTEDVKLAVESTGSAIQDLIEQNKESMGRLEALDKESARWREEALALEKARDEERNAHLAALNSTVLDVEAVIDKQLGSVESAVKEMSSKVSTEASQAQRDAARDGLLGTMGASQAQRDASRDGILGSIDGKLSSVASGSDMSRIEKAIKDVGAKIGTGSGTSVDVTIDNGKVEGLLQGISDKLDGLLEGPGDGEGSLGEIDWKRPEKTESMKFELDTSEREKGILDALGGLGLGVERLDSFHPRNFTASFRLPVGGNITAIKYQTIDFNLGNPPPEVASILETIRRFINTMLRAIVSLYFVVSVWRLLWSK